MTSKKKKKFDFSLWFFRISFIAILLILGGYLEFRGWVGFKYLKIGYQNTNELIKQQLNGYPMLLKPIVYKEIGVTIHKKDETYDSVVLMQGWFEDGLQLRLINKNGDIVNKWMIDFHEIWQNPTHISPSKNIPKTRLNYHAQGMYIFEDGSIMTNVGNYGTVKMDKCGKVVWTVDRMTHHSINRDHDGSFWIPANQDYQKIDDDLLFGGVTRDKIKETAGRYENLLLNIDENGKVINEISVLRGLVDADMEYQIFDGLAIRKYDPTHINDIEIVNKALADKINDVNEYDLLVSIRQLHMLAIFDRYTGKIKWYKSGPWVRQHDPDIDQDGNISVFNNRNHGFFVNKQFGSNIINYDPLTDRSKIIYPPPKPSKRQLFYTDIEGSHQKLPNSNILIVETRRGRVIEVNQTGEIVWEYIQSYDNKRAALIEDAMCISPSYFKVKNWNCGEN